MSKTTEHIWYYRRDPGPYGDKFHFQVYLGPALIGSIRRNSQGTHTGTWDWNGRWGGVVDGRAVLGNGRRETQQEALDELRQVFYRTLADNRRIIVQMLVSDPAIRELADQFIKEIQP